LTPGLHPIRVRYVQRGGESVLRLSWQQPSVREAFTSVPFVEDSQPPPVFRRIDKALDYPRLVATSWAVWLLGGVAILACASLEIAAGRRLMAVMGRGDAVLLVVVTGVILGAALDLGVLPWRGWAPDEIKPVDVIDATRQSFSGGWYHLYPPVMFYVFAVIHAPFEWLAASGWLALTDAPTYATLHTLDRAATLVFGVASCAGVALLCHRVAGAAAARWAPYALAGVPLFAFYSKTTNVDMAYTFWVIAAMLAFTEAVSLRRVRHHVALSLAAAAAIASKDQAYGYFVGPALWLVWSAWRASSGRPTLQRWRAVAGDPPLWAGLVTCLVAYAFASGVLWNVDGVRAHVAFLTGQASAPFRMFPNTPTGVVELLAWTARILAQALGPLVTVASLAGIIVAANQASVDALRLLVFPASYVLTFIGLVGYVYDRFLLAVLPCAALFAAIAIARGLSLVPGIAARRVVAAVLAVALLTPAVVLDHRLATDSRFEAERWMATHVTDDPLVLGVGTSLYLPNLQPYQHRMVPRARADDLLGWQSDLIVFNEDWLARPGQTRGTNVPDALAQAGYEEVYATGPRPPAPWGLGALVTGLAVDPLVSNLSKTSPPISIWRKRE
jgi:hypothetical protein